MAAAPFLSLQSIALTFGYDPLLTQADLFVNPGDRIALVGRNGSGKSTLLKIAAGLIEADKGERRLMPRARIDYLPQEPDLSAYATTLDYCLDGLSEAEDHHAPLLKLEEVGLNGQENPKHLSGGETRRAALARVLSRKPEVLLLDEPTNHLDLASIEWLTDEVAALPSAIVVISHDRRFLSDITRKTVWLDRGVTRVLNKGFSAFEAWRDDIFAEEERAAHKESRRIAAEEDWLRYGVTARRKRNQRRLRALEDLRQSHRNRKTSPDDVAIEIVEAEQSGKLVVHIENLNKSFENRVIVKDFSTRILRGDRVAIVGANGTGKTTLVKMITGELKPDSGRIKLGKRLDLATLDQKRSALKPSTTLADALTGGDRDFVVVNDRERHVFSYMKDFLFTPAQGKTPLSALSGGERARVMLARAMILPSNFLVLDEPTNDLDLETLDLLQEMINDYPGTVLLVSHDRDFIDRTMGSVIVPEGGGRWVEYAGGYQDMERQRREASPSPERSSRPALSERKAKPVSDPAPRTKLSYKETYALQTLPKTIETLEAKLADYTRKLSDQTFYHRDPEGFARLSHDFATAEAEKGRLEEEWLRLEMLRESVERS